MQKNEVELCEILIRLLEAEAGSKRERVSYPEKDGSGPPVELRLRVGDRDYAVEHTLIEPFPAAIQTSKEFAELTDEIVASLDGTLPVPGTYRLLFPVNPTAGRHRRTHAALRDAIIQWVLSAARELHDEAPDRLGRDRMPFGYESSRSAEIEGLALTLRRRFHWQDSGQHDGALFLNRVVGEDIEELRRVRLKTALDKKLGKLMACATEGDATILILEFSDIALTNHVVIAQALEVLLAEREDGPDHVIIADTTLPGAWYFFRPVIDGAFAIDMDFIEVERCSIVA